MEELLKKLLSGEGKLSLMLLEAKQITLEYESNEELLKFIDSEINGYEGDDLPSYRKIKGTIVCDIRTGYGSIQNNVPLDVGTISDKMGIDISVALISDGIGFIEDNLKHLTKPTVVRILPNELVISLNQLVQYNNPNITLITASHSFGKAGIEHVITKVREELISKLQTLLKNRKITPKPEIAKSENLEARNKIEVFVTYSWENEENNDLVISFVNFLRKSGYNALMDRLQSQNQTAINFNFMMLDGIKKADKVIVILSPSYKDKAEKNQGGVGTEYGLIVEELKSNSNKFILSSFGKNSLNEITPLGYKGREILNLKIDQENEFNQLHSKLQSKNIINFSDVDETLQAVKEKEIKPFKL